MINVLSSRRECGQQNRCNDECNTISKVSDNQRPPATKAVDEHHAKELRDERDHGADGLVLQRVLRGDADLAINGHAVILDGTDSSHLDRSLEGTGQKQAAERRLVPEQLGIRLRFVLVLEGDGLLDLVELSPHPHVIHIAVSVQPCESLESFLDASVVDEPSGRFGEEQDEKSEDAGWDDLDSEADTPLVAVGGPEANESPV